MTCISNRYDSCAAAFNNSLEKMESFLFGEKDVGDSTVKRVALVAFETLKNFGRAALLCLELPALALFGLVASGSEKCAGVCSKVVSLFQRYCPAKTSQQET